jgi:hypothetical protein
MAVILMVSTIFACFEVGAYLNRDHAPAWTRRGWVGEGAALLFVSLISIATAGVIGGLVDAAEQGVKAFDAGIVGAALVGAVLLARWRVRRRRSFARAPASAQPVDQGAEETTEIRPPSPPRDQPPAGGSIPRAA